MVNHPNRKRITDQDLEIRHSVMHVLLAALGYVPDDSSKATLMETQRRFNAAVAAGRMRIDSNGHYAVTREYFASQVAKNAKQPRQRNSADALAC